MEKLRFKKVKFFQPRPSRKLIRDENSNLGLPIPNILTILQVYYLRLARMYYPKW